MTKGPRREEAAAWLSAVREDLERVAAAIEPLLVEQTRLRSQEALLLRLVQSFDSSESVEGGQVATVTVAAPPVQGSVRDHVCANVAEILREHGGGPMHINDIHAKFLASGIHVPGAGRPANLTAHLSRCSDIVSPNRGFYQLGRLQENGRAKRRQH